MATIGPVGFTQKMQGGHNARGCRWDDSETPAFFSAVMNVLFT
jgi:hypothetical protein